MVSVFGRGVLMVLGIFPLFPRVTSQMWNFSKVRLVYWGGGEHSGFDGLLGNALRIEQEQLQGRTLEVSAWEITQL